MIITWLHVCINFNKLIWLIQKNEKIDILSLLFMPFTGNKSPGAKKGSDEWWWDNFTNIFWVKRTFISSCCHRISMDVKISRQIRDKYQCSFKSHWQNSMQIFTKLGIYGLELDVSWIGCYFRNSTSLKYGIMNI